MQAELHWTPTLGGTSHAWMQQAAFTLAPDLSRAGAQAFHGFARGYASSDNQFGGGQSLFPGGPDLFVSIVVPPGADLKDLDQLRVSALVANGCVDLADPQRSLGSIAGTAVVVITHGGKTVEFTKSGVIDDGTGWLLESQDKALPYNPEPRLPGFALRHWPRDAAGALATPDPVLLHDLATRDTHFKGKPGQWPGNPNSGGSECIVGYLPRQVLVAAVCTLAGLQVPAFVYASLRDWLTGLFLRPSFYYLGDGSVCPLSKLKGARLGIHGIEGAVNRPSASPFAWFDEQHLELMRLWAMVVMFGHPLASKLYDASLEGVLSRDGAKSKGAIWKQTARAPGYYLVELGMALWLKGTTARPDLLAAYRTVVDGMRAGMMQFGGLTVLPRSPYHFGSYYHGWLTPAWLLRIAGKLKINTEGYDHAWDDDPNADLARPWLAYAEQRDGKKPGAYSIAPTTPTQIGGAYDIATRVLSWWQWAVVTHGLCLGAEQEGILSAIPDLPSLVRTVAQTLMTDGCEPGIDEHLQPTSTLSFYESTAPIARLPEGGLKFDEANTYPWSGTAPWIPGRFLLAVPWLPPKVREPMLDRFHTMWQHAADNALSEPSGVEVWWLARMRWGFAA